MMLQNLEQVGRSKKVSSGSYVNSCHCCYQELKNSRLSASINYYMKEDPVQKSHFRALIFALTCETYTLHLCILNVEGVSIRYSVIQFQFTDTGIFCDSHF